MSKNIKLYILAIFLLNSIFIFSGRIINIEDTDYKNSLVYAKGENVSFTGKILTFYEDGKLKDETMYKNGKREGLSKYYYQNGKLAVEQNFNNDGNIEGIRKDYWENGNIQEECLYKNGLREGILKEYDEKGKLVGTTYFEKLPDSMSYPQ